jgi:hypothetical protein
MNFLGGKPSILAAASVGVISAARCTHAGRGYGLQRQKTQTKQKTQKPPEGGFVSGPRR